MSNQITFSFPLRWLEEDREFLASNLKKQIEKAWAGNDDDIFQTVIVYQVDILCVCKKPVNVRLTQSQIQTMLKPVFKNGKCIKFDINYQPHTSKTMLPIIDFRIYF